MNPALAFDLTLCALVLGVASWTVVSRDAFGSIISFIVYGLVLAIVWVRLGAPDVALAEAAIGAGLTGVLLLGALARMAPGPGPRRPAAGLQILAAGSCAGLGLGLAWSVVLLMAETRGLQAAVAQNLPAAGVDNPVTAVLLNFRGFDTLLESLVLLAALLGVWALGPDEAWGGRPGLAQHVRPRGVLATFGRLLPGVGVVIGVYVVWTGSSAPGGAFQAAAILAAVWLLAIIAGGVETPRVRATGLRVSLVGGPAVFLGVGAAALAVGGPFLSYPPHAAKLLILGVEAALTISLAATLTLLVAGPPVRP